MRWAWWRTATRHPTTWTPRCERDAASLAVLSRTRTSEAWMPSWLGCSRCTHRTATLRRSPSDCCGSTSPPGGTRFAPDRLAPAENLAYADREGVDVGLGDVPRGNPADLSLAGIPDVERRSSLELGDRVPWDPHEDGVRCGLAAHLDAGGVAHRVDQPTSHRVCVASESQPQVVGEQRGELCGDEELLARQLGGLLADELRARRKWRVEPHHGFAEQGTVLRRTEGQDVHTLDRAANVTAEGSHGIGEAGPVHVDVHPVVVRHGGQRGQLSGLPHGADLGALADADDARLYVVLVTDDVQLRLDLGRVDAAVRGCQREQRGAGEP